MSVWLLLGVVLIVLALVHIIPLVLGLILGLVLILADVGPRYRGRGPWGR